MSYKSRAEMWMLIEIKELTEPPGVLPSCGTCHQSIEPGSSCYTEIDYEWQNYYHQTCIDQQERCASCEGRGFVFTEAPHLGYILTARPRTSAKCQACEGRGWNTATASRPAL